MANLGSTEIQLGISAPPVIVVRPFALGLRLNRSNAGTNAGHLCVNRLFPREIREVEITIYMEQSPQAPGYHRVRCTRQTACKNFLRRSARLHQSAEVLFLELTRLRKATESQHGFHQPWEAKVEARLESELPGFFAPRRKLHNIESDLRYLGLKPMICCASPGVRNCHRP